MNRADLSRAQINSAKLDSAKLEKAVLNFANMEGVVLSDALMWYTQLEGTKLSGARLSGARLNGARAVGASFAVAKLNDANLQGADLTRANLWNADLQGANVRRANFTEAEFRGADLRGAIGLFGFDRASGLGTVKDAEHAICAHPNDFASWALLRFVGTLHLFSASYLSFLAIVVYATVMRWVNTHVDRWHEWAREHAGNLAEKGAVGPLADLVERIPHFPVQRHFGILMAAIGLLSFATTLFALFCPDPIKEATETRWTRELNQPLIEYRSAMYHRPVVRYATLVSFTLGGGYTLCYILWRAFNALSYLIAG